MPDFIPDAFAYLMLVAIVAVSAYWTGYAAYSIARTVFAGK